MLLKNNQLLVLHILELVLKVAELSLLVLHLPCGCLEIVFELLLLVPNDSKLIFQVDLGCFRLLDDELRVLFLLLEVSLELFNERLVLFGHQMGPVQVCSALAKVLLRLAHLIFEPLRKLLVGLVLARSFLQLTLQPAYLSLKTHLNV